MNRPAWITMTFASVLVASCGGGDARQCTFNSDCPAGRYCTAAGACTADCTTDSECATMLGAGAACSSFGMCVAPPDAGPTPDAGGGMDAGRDAGERDAAVPVDAASVDARVCAASEVCTPSVPGAVVEDENCNGAIDEGCDWFFGRPQWLARPGAAVDASLPASMYAPRLSMDGLRLYFVSCNAGAAICQPFVSERPTRDAEFGSAQRLPGPFTGFRTWAVTPSNDELELFVAADTGPGGDIDLWRATRASRSDAFDMPTRITELSQSGTNEQSTALSADGLEIFFSRAVVMMRATRPSTGAAFGAPVALTGITISADAPSLSPDGLTMFFAGRASGMPWRIYYSERADPTSTTFSTPVLVDALIAGTGSHDAPFFSATTREMFYVASGGWSAARLGLWRVQVCRDRACAEPLVDCPSGGTRSPDGYHCYVPGTTAVPWDMADGTCGGTGRHLATIHSRAEQDLVWSMRPSGADGLLLGGYDGNGPATSPVSGRPTIPQCVRTAGEVTCGFGWTTLEPWTYAAWGDDNPNVATQDCLVLWNAFVASPGDFGDYPCDWPLPYVCESELWPTW